MVQEQSAIPDYEKPKLLVEDIAMKMQALDREVKYLINKAKTFRPKTKPKVPKNKTESNDTTTADSDDKKEDSDTKEDKNADTGRKTKLALFFIVRLLDFCRLPTSKKY